ncbi:MAG: hypothetical protein RLZZ501_1639 [Pseudomonadota bacterium]|jgi:hypothetical protein
MIYRSEDGHGRREPGDDRLHDILRKGLLEGRIQLFADPRMIDFQGSPVHDQWDHLLPLIGLMTLALAILLLGGLAVGIVGMFLFVLVYLVINRTFIGWRLRTRTQDYLCQDIGRFLALWRMGGIALTIPGAGEAPCVAPKGDWRKFIRRHFGEGVPAGARADLLPLESAPDAAELIEPPPAPRPAMPSPGTHWTSVADLPPDDQARP